MPPPVLAADAVPRHAGEISITFRNSLSNVPKMKVAEVARMLKPVHARGDGPSKLEKVKEVIDKLKAIPLTQAFKLVQTNAQENWRTLPFQVIAGARCMHQHCS